MNDVTCTNSESFREMEFVKGGCTPYPVLTYDGYTLRAGTDYTISYKNNKKAGATAKIVVSGKGNFKGKREFGFTVRQKDISKVSMYTPNVPYTGKKNKYQSKPILTDSDGTRLKVNTDYTGRAITNSKEDIKSATIKVAGTTSPLTYGEDYEVVSYSKNVKKGTATAVLCGKGKYCGEKSVKFKIVSRNIQSDK